MSRPLVTVAIPLYNGAAFLAETLQSVLRQSFRDMEVLISDDGSSDESLQVAKSLSDPRVRIDVHPHLGMAGNWNRCVRLARGRYLKLLPQDDVLRPDCVSESLALLEHCPRAVLMFSRRDVLYDAADPASVQWVQLYGQLDGPLEPLAMVNPGAALLDRWAQRQFHGNLIGEPAVTMFPTELAQRLGGFPRRMYQDLDYAFWIRLIARGDVCFTPEPLCLYRFHAANATRDNYGSGRLRTERLRFLKTLARDRAVRRQVPELGRWVRAERQSLMKQRLKGLAEATHVIGPIRTARADLAAVLRPLIGTPRSSRAEVTDAGPDAVESPEADESLGRGGRLPEQRSLDRQHRAGEPDSIELPS